MNEQDKIEFYIMPKDVRNDEKQGQQKDNFSGVSCNPKFLTETINGAKNRAKNAYEHARDELKEYAVIMELTKIVSKDIYDKR